MKTAFLRTVAAVSLIGFTVALPLQARGGDSSPAKVSKFSGTIVNVDDRGRTVTAKGFWAWSHKTFNLGDSCKVSVEGRDSATLKDLLPGSQVEVQYSSVGGVNVASQVAGTFRDFTGHIVAVTPASHSVTLKRGNYEKTFTLAEDCNFLVNDQKSELGDLKIGQKVTIKFTATDLAHLITQNGFKFVGTVEVLDAEARTIRAQHLLTDQKFYLAKECPIVINGKPDGQFSDLRIGEKLVVNYEDVDGVLVANRVACEREQEKPASGRTAQSNVPISEH